MLNAEDLVRLMAEPERRRVIAALILSPGNAVDVVRVSGLELRQVMAALDRLGSAGLVELGGDGTYVLLEEAFKLAARAEASSRPTAERGDGVVDRAFVDGRLEKLPRKRSKRLLVLDHLAQRFEPGRHYGEREVNRILLAFDDDVATLRRYLVDEGFLDRADGSYWRSGGTVDLGTEPEPGS